MLRVSSMWLASFTTCFLFAFIEVHAFEKGPVSSITRCPGLYCGRQQLSDGNWSECGACPRGYRANATSACVLCTDSPEFYDWLYLGFMAILALVLHWFCIDTAMRRRILGQTVPGDVRFSKEVLVLHASALLEVGAAAAATLLLLEPRGQLSLRSCPTQQLADWYTLLHNPSPNYRETLHCTQEAVFPLYSMVFIFYAFSVLGLLLMRPWLVCYLSPRSGTSHAWLAPYFLPRHGKTSIYAALYFFPLLALIHALLGGLIYYAFPYIMIVMSLISSAAHFAFKEDQTVRALVVSTLTNLRNCVILLGHWLLHAYAIIAVTQLRDIVVHGSFLALVPVPALFYILTARFTDPNKIHSD